MPPVRNHCHDNHSKKFGWRLSFPSRVKRHSYQSGMVLQEPDADAEQPSAADAAVTVNASEAAAPAAKTEAADKPASKAPARSARVAAPAAKIRLGSKCAPVSCLVLAVHCISFVHVPSVSVVYCKNANKFWLPVLTLLASDLTLQEPVSDPLFQVPSDVESMLFWRYRKKGWKAHLEKFQRSALQFLSSRSGIALLAFLAVMVLLGAYGNRPQGVRV